MKQRTVTMNDIPRKEFFRVYLSKLFAGSNTPLTDRDLDLLVLTKLNMNKFDTPKFARMLNMSQPNINNYKSKLYKLGCLQKTTDDGKYEISHQLNIDYTDGLQIIFNLTPAADGV